MRFNRKRIIAILVFLLLSFFMITFGNPLENNAIATRTVKFIDSYNDKTLDTKTVELGKAVTAPTVPKHKDLVFINWYIEGTDNVADLSKILNNLVVETKYADDKNNNGIPDYDDKYYTVRFIDGLDDSLLKAEKVLVGLDAIAPTVITHEGYTFTSWDKVFTNVKTNLTVTSLYNINSYTLTINYKYVSNYKDIAPLYSEVYNYNSIYNVTSPVIAGYTADKLVANGLMPASNKDIDVLYTANKNTAYKVEHYTENLTSGYTLVDTDNLTGTTDTLTSATAKTLEGFTVQAFDQENINGNGSTIVKIYYSRNVYTLTYTVDGEEYQMFGIKYEDTITPLAELTKIGYTFSGWSEIPTTMPDSDVLVTGSFNIVTYHVIYNLNQTGVTGALESNILDAYNINTPLYEVKPATSLSHSFDGWYTDPVNGNKVTTLAGGTIGDVILYAHWTANKYTVSFNSNGGSSVSSINDILYNNTITKPSDPTKLGYDFNDWYKEDTLTNKWNFTSDTVKASLTLYARWTETIYNLTYNINDDEVTSAVNPSNPSTYTISSAFTFAKASSASHNFLGWFTDPLSGSELLGITLGSTGSKTLYAHWSIKGYTLTFIDTNHNEITRNVNWGDDLEDIPNITPVTGYVCNWDRTDFTNITSDDTINSDCDLITYNVTYNLNQTGVTGASHSNILNTYNVNTGAYNLLDATSLSHSFDGWYTDPVNGTKVTTLAGGEIGDVTLYAHWTANKYTVSFDSNGGSSVSPINNVSYNDTITKPSDPTKLGFGFENWYKEDTLANKWNFTTDTVKASLTLYANWTKEIYNLVFNINNAGVVDSVNPSNPSTYTISDTLVFNNATSKSHDFVGWYTLPTSGSKVTGITAGTITGDQTYYAHWSIKSFNLTVDVNGGTWNGITPQTLNYGESVTINNPEKDGYNFNGWTKTGADSTLNGTTFTMGSENATLTANWTPRTDLNYTIYYRLDGTTTDIQSPTLVTGKTFGETYTEIAPSITGYENVLPTTKTVPITTGTNEIIFYYEAIAVINASMTSVASSGSSTVEYGDTITYTLTITNIGTGAGLITTKDLILANDSDKELIDTGLTAAEIADRNALLSNTGLVKTVNAGTTYTLVFKVKVTGNAGSTINNQLTYVINSEPETTGTLKTYNIEKTVSLVRITESGANIVLTLDTSGSMDGSRLNSMKTAAKNFINLQDLTKTNICIVRFSTSAEKLICSHELTGNINSKINQLKNAINGLNASGWTSYSSGLTKSEQYINTLKTSFSGNSNYLVFLSDGDPIIGSDWWGGYIYDTGYTEIANRIKNNGTTIYTIGFETTNSADAILESLASSGKYYEAATSDLNSVFANISADIEINGSITTAGGYADINTLLTGMDMDSDVTIFVNGAEEISDKYAVVQSAGYITADNRLNITAFNPSDVIKFKYYAN